MDRAREIVLIKTDLKCARVTETYFAGGEAKGWVFGEVIEIKPM